MPAAPPASAFILAAGLGTRLRPLTDFRPKPLLPVCGVPMLDQALAHLRAHGFEHALVNAHHLWEQVAGWAERNGVGLQVELPEVLGTGGGLRAARERLAGRFVIVNADVLCDVDLTALFEATPEGGAAMALYTEPAVARRSPVEIDETGMVVRITSIIPSDRGIPGTHFTGIHALDRGALDRVPEGFACIIQTAYRELVPAGLVRGLIHRGTWVDIGSPEGYLQANLDVLEGRIQPPLDPWTRGEQGPSGSWIGRGARIEGEIQRCIIGDGAVVPAGARLVDCVVWDGVEVPVGTFERCVAYDGGRVLCV